MAIRAPGVLGKVMAIYLWDVTVAHGGDHYSFGRNITNRPTSSCASGTSLPRSPAWRRSSTWGGPGGCNGDDLYRAQMAHRMFF